MHLLHSNINNLFTVCVLSYKLYCAYTPSNGAMALLNKISVFRIPCFTGDVQRVILAGRKRGTWPATAQPPSPGIPASVSVRQGARGRGRDIMILWLSVVERLSLRYAANRKFSQTCTVAVSEDELDQSALKTAAGVNLTPVPQRSWRRIRGKAGSLPV